MARYLLFFSLLISPLRSSAVPSPDAVQDTSSIEGYQAVSALPGERCVVCGSELSPDDIALIVRGRRFPLDRTMVAEFLNNRDRYLAQMQPRSALFSESAESPPGTALGGIPTGWFLFGLYVLVALISGGLSAYASFQRTLKPSAGFLIGVLFPVAGYVYVLLKQRKSPGEVPSGLAKIPTTSSPVPCNACGHLNHPSASQCTQCHTVLHPEHPSEALLALRQQH